MLCDNQSGKYLASLKQRQRAEKDLANGASQAAAQSGDNAKRGRTGGTEGASHSAHSAAQFRPPEGVSLAAPYCSFVSRPHTPCLSIYHCCFIFIRIDVPWMPR